MKIGIIRTLLFITIALLISASVFSQSVKEAKGHFELEADPIAYFLKGYSFHAGYQKKSFRYDAGIFGLDVPKAFSKNSNFCERTKGFGFKIDYVGAEAKGWFVGVETDYTWINATYKTTNQEANGNELGIGLRGGYRFLFGKPDRLHRGFYLAPWVGLDKVMATSKIAFKEADYKHGTIRIFPTVHAGWRF